MKATKMTMEEKRTFLGHMYEKALGLGADGNEEEAKSLVRRIMRILDRMTEEERGPVLNVLYIMLSKREGGT